jgi:rare lipoprotein A (peptidoglycan hydrolase)
MNRYLFIVLILNSLLFSLESPQTSPNKNTLIDDYKFIKYNENILTPEKYTIYDNYTLLKSYNKLIDYKKSNDLYVSCFNPYKDKIIENFDAVTDKTPHNYKVFGKFYKTFIPKVGEIYKGMASWYGGHFHGQETSSGEKYNKFMFTAAHKTLPLNTIVEVINKTTKESVVVRINDRGPFVGERMIDLSYAAAKKLDITKYGTFDVSIKVLGMFKK